MAENYGQETMLFSTNQPEHLRQSDSLQILQPRHQQLAQGGIDSCLHKLCHFCACCRHHLRYHEIQGI